MCGRHFLRISTSLWCVNFPVSIASTDGTLSDWTSAYWWPNSASRRYTGSILMVFRASIHSIHKMARRLTASLEAARLDVVMIVLLWNVTGITSAAAGVPVKFHRDWKSLNTNLAASKLREILRSYRLVNGGPVVYCASHHAWSDGEKSGKLSIALQRFLTRNLSLWF